MKSVPQTPWPGFLRKESETLLREPDTRVLGAKSSMSPDCSSLGLDKGKRTGIRAKPLSHVCLHYSEDTERMLKEMSRKTAIYLAQTTEISNPEDVLRACIRSIHSLCFGNENWIIIFFISILPHNFTDFWQSGI